MNKVYVIFATDGECDELVEIHASAAYAICVCTRLNEEDRKKYNSQHLPPKYSVQERTVVQEAEGVA